MKISLLFLLVFSFASFSQSKVSNPLTFKGEHYALYNKCKVAITFCELTQQSYTSCGSVKNCYGLYVMPGDTFYINIEDKTQSEVLSADISFGGYFPSITNFTFQPIDINCIPQQALQIAIPLTATIGSSFQVVAQNTAYVNVPTYTAGVPPPFAIYVGGQQPQFTFALSDFTLCPIVEEVSVIENYLSNKNGFFYPNPTDGFISLSTINTKEYDLEVYDAIGNRVIQLMNTSLKSIDLTELKNGIYICKILSNKQIVVSEKVSVIK